MSTTQAPFALSDPRHQALESLLTGATHAEAAETCGVPLGTLRDWLAQPEFRAALSAGLKQLLGQVYLQLAVGAVSAVRTLIEISRDPDQKAAVRTSASNKLLALLGPGALPAAVAPARAPSAGLGPSDPPVLTPEAILANVMADLKRKYSQHTEPSPPPAAPAGVPPPASRTPANGSTTRAGVPSPNPRLKGLSRTIEGSFSK